MNKSTLVPHPGQHSSKGSSLKAPTYTVPANLVPSTMSTSASAKGQVKQQPSQAQVAALGVFIKQQQQSLSNERQPMTATGTIQIQPAQGKAKAAMASRKQSSSSKHRKTSQGKGSSQQQLSGFCGTNYAASNVVKKHAPRGAANSHSNTHTSNSRTPSKQVARQSQYSESPRTRSTMLKNQNLLSRQHHLHSSTSNRGYQSTHYGGGGGGQSAASVAAMQKAQLTQGIPVSINGGHGAGTGKGSASGMLSATHKALPSTKAGNSSKQNAAKTPLSKFLLAESARHNTTHATTDHHIL